MISALQILLQDYLTGIKIRGGNSENKSKSFVSQEIPNIILKPQLRHICLIIVVILSFAILPGAQRLEIMLP